MPIQQHRFFIQTLIVCLLLLGTKATLAQGFSRAVLSDVLPFAYEVAVADLDGDGDMDIAVTSQVGDVVYWVENRGDTYHAWMLQSYPQGAPYGIAAGDFNGDGRTDLVVAMHGIDQFVLLTNTGGGGENQFSTSTILDSCNGAWSVKAGDVNGDGLTDLVTTENYGNVVRIFTQMNGQLTMTMAMHVPVNPYDARFVDFDSDGDMDIVGSSQTQPIYWIEHGLFGADTWTLHSLDFGVNSRQVAVADLNQDGQMEIIAAPAYEQFVKWWSRSGTEWTEHVLDGIVVQPRGIEVVDLDQDGHLDIVASTMGDGAQQMRWWRNNGNGSFSARSMPDGDGFSGMAIADFDLDGDSDVVVANYWGSSVDLFRNSLGVPAVISGVIRSADQGTPVAGVVTRILETGALGRTDANGMFRLYTVDGTFTVQTHGVCWNDTFAVGIQAARGDTTPLNFNLVHPELDLGMSSLNLTAHNQVMSAVELPLSNTGDGPMTIHASASSQNSDTGWLSVEPESTVVQAGQGFTFTVRVLTDTTNTSDFAYYGDIDLRTNACPDSFRQVAVIAYVLDVPGRAQVPATTALNPAYPNPFNGETSISFDLAATSDVTVELYDISGRHVRLLTSGRLTAGSHQIPLVAHDLSSGIYFLALQAGGRNFSQKLMLIK